MKNQTFKGHLTMLVLAIVKSHPMHGYAVIETLRKKSGGILDLPEGTIYPVLHRLEQQRYLASSWTTAAGRRRRIYRLTSAGQRALARDRGQWKVFTSTIQAVLEGAS